MYLSIKQGLLISATLLISFVASFSVSADAAPETPSLSVRGEAQLMVSPDQVIMVAGVLSEAKQAKKALADNGRAMQKVMDALLALDLKKKEITTQRFSVQPKWSPRPRGADSSWRSDIIGYRVNNSVQVKTAQLDLIGELITQATQAGANQIKSVSFGLSNPREYRSKALFQAVENARADADVTAKAVGSSLRGILTLHVDQAVASVESVEKSMLMRSASMADIASAPPINSGDISVRASVSITYQLAK
ncbi:MAG: hypothetical protein ACJAUP_001293 [Cellvibrionaceae bacterium]|jgi:uncharacterized protein YggE